MLMHVAKQCAFVLISVLVLWTNVVFSDARAYALGEIPPTSLKIPAMVAERSVSTFIPSPAAPGKGIAVNVIYPAKGRYEDGAPVVVIVPNGASGLDLSMHAAQVGFVEVRFAFPGSGKAEFSSGGIFDNRGVQSQIALRDVLLFAGGKIADIQGKTISQLVSTKISRESKTIGIVGWLNGGNISLVTVAKFANELGFIGWSAFYESPLGSLCFTGNLGSSQDFLLNSNYREGTCATGNCLVDYRKLTWVPSGYKSFGSHKRQGEPEIPGIVFFDENGNKKWDETSEFALSYMCDVGLDKQIYPPQVTRALESMGTFKKCEPMAVMEKEPTYAPSAFTKRRNMVLTPIVSSSPKKPAMVPLKRRGKVDQVNQAQKGESEDLKADQNLTEKNYWPRNIATPLESQAYFQERDGLLYIAEICQKLPEMMVTVFASKLDHMQRQSDHPHIALQYNAWLANKLRWVRLNPDPIYVSQVTDMNARNFVNNQPNTSLDASAMDVYLEPEGLIPDYCYMDAAIAELADRKQTKKQFAVLSTPIFSYTNGAKEPVSR